MTEVKITVDRATATAKMSGTLTSGMVGVKVDFSYSDVWNGLNKTAVFTAGKVTRDVLNADGTVEVPPEVLQKPGEKLYIGVYGTNKDGTLVIPTVRAYVGIIMQGSDPSGDESTSPELPVWAQLQNEVNELKESGAGGSGKPGEDGGYYTPSVSRLDENTVQFQFTPSKSGMPAVPPALVELPGGGNDSGQNPTDKLALTSPNGTVWNITVSDTGVITATKVTSEDGGNGGEEEIVIATIPVVRITGDLTGISGDDYVNVVCHYLDSVNNVEFTDYAEIAYQGSSSMDFVNVENGVDKAKNHKIKLYTDEARETKSKRVFKDWFATNNFHIKANYGDATNIMNNMMMHYLTKSYQYLTPLPRDGARYTVDGFPVLLYINGVFCGIRFWNLKQSDKVYNLTDENDLCYQIGLNNGSSKGDNSGAFIYGNLNSGSNEGKNFADARAEIDYYWEDRVWDKTGNHPDVLYNTIQWVSEATDDEFKTNLEQYFDKEYLIHYFVVMMTCGMGDSICKNFNVYDGSEIVDPKTYITAWANNRFVYMDSVFEQTTVTETWESGFINDAGELETFAKAYVSTAYTPVTQNSAMTIEIPDGYDVAEIRVAEYDIHKQFVRRYYVPYTGASSLENIAVGKTTVFVRLGVTFSGVVSSDEITTFFANMACDTSELAANYEITAEQGNTLANASNTDATRVTLRISNLMVAERATVSVGDGYSVNVYHVNGSYNNSSAWVETESEYVNVTKYVTTVSLGVIVKANDDSAVDPETIKGLVTIS